MILSYVAGLTTWIVAEWLLDRAGVRMEVEIAGSVLALAAGYLIVHTLTLKLVPREEEPTLKL